MDIKNISEKDFAQAVEKAVRPVLVQFYATWSGPCKSLALELECLAREILGAQIVKVNVDDNNHLAERFSVSNLPCMMLFKNGEPVKTVTGFRTKSQIKKVLEECE